MLAKPVLVGWCVAQWYKMTYKLKTEQETVLCSSKSHFPLTTFFQIHGVKDHLKSGGLDHERNRHVTSDCMFHSCAEQSVGRFIVYRVTKHC